ncbi:MAG: exopolyphosphatase [Cyclobacteriaceae bacterium]|nr:exopolyphosphatase [Cyclobacteriaceae bacterium]
MRTAIIDLGTNTFHLLVADHDEHQISIIHREYVATRMGQGGINHGVITAEAITRAADAMRRFRIQIDQLHVQHVHAFGTSALRNASNSAEVCAQLLSVSGIKVDVVEGNKEASLIYEGIRRGVKMDLSPALMMDIGGGSVEFIIGNSEAIHWKTSIEVGGQRLMEKFFREDPLPETDYQRLRSYLNEVLTPVFEALHTYQPEVLIGSAGSFDTLSEIHCIRHQLPYDGTAGETPLSLATVQACHEFFINNNRAQRLAVPGMLEMRVDMIVMATSLIQLLLDRHPFQSIRVSTYSLKEGALSLAAAGRLQ